MKVKIINEDMVKSIVDHMNRMTEQFPERKEIHDAYRTGVHDVMKRAVIEREIYSHDEFMEGLEEMGRKLAGTMSIVIFITCAVLFTLFAIFIKH